MFDNNYKDKDFEMIACTWKPEPDCASCGIAERLYCRVDPKLRKAFYVLFIPAILMAFFGLSVIGVMLHNWWFLGGYVAFIFILFPLIEMFVLCRHCPFYSEYGNKLTCLTTEEMPKIYKYDPRPMNGKEKLAMYFYYLIIMGFPIAAIGSGVFIAATNYAQYGILTLLGLIGILLSFILAVITFNYCLSIYVCRRCVHFSCPWNSVEKETVDTYLRKNPAMMKAWEESGYILGKEEK